MERLNADLAPYEDAMMDDMLQQLLDDMISEESARQFNGTPLKEDADLFGDSDE